MKIIYGVERIRRFKKPVVALGIFDGVHIAHRRILRDVVSRALRIGGSSVVVTFWPHPQKAECLYSLEHRLRLIAELGIDVCAVIRFNKWLAGMRAEDFVEGILLKKLGAQEIYIGRNFRFGQGGHGSSTTLRQLSLEHGFRLKVFEVIRKDKTPISSTYIRNLIRRGELNAAEKLLNHPVSVLGTVTKGICLGRRLGFPTANINPHHDLIPPRGIYAVKVLFKGRTFFGACYIGTRPTLARLKTHDSRHKTISIEVYIFNLNKNLYGKYLEIQFVKKIRQDRKFVSFPALAVQIEKDIKSIKKLFSLHLARPQYMPAQACNIH
jgi:riboflavin kinase/FMN adenylyltransferase